MRNTKVNLSPELIFLINCCQTNLSKEEIEEIRSYLNTQHSTLSTLIGLANQHGILPLVYKTLKKIHADQQPSTIGHRLEQLLEDFKPAYSQIARKNIMMSAELIRIMNLLKENNIKALAFKGPTLAQMVYGDITLRQFGDLDILVDEPLTILSNKTCLHIAKDFSLISVAGGVHTELHWQLFEKNLNISILSCMVREKCQSVKINNKDIRTLQNELLLVYLCLHGAKHTFERIEWICDIDRLIRSAEINWEEAIAIADQSHSRHSFYLGLSLAQQLFHTPLPDIVQSDIEANNTVILLDMTLKQMSKKKNERSDFQKNRETFFYQSRLFDQKIDMIRFYLSTFFAVSTSDCQTFVLPEKLKFLYIILRPIRLVLSHGKRILGV
jgi:hypothetical protein